MVFDSGIQLVIVPVRDGCDLIALILSNRVHVAILSAVQVEEILMRLRHLLSAAAGQVRAYPYSMLNSVSGTVLTQHSILYQCTRTFVEFYSRIPSLTLTLKIDIFSDFVILVFFLRWLLQCSNLLRSFVIFGL